MNSRYHWICWSTILTIPLLAGCGTDAPSKPLNPQTGGVPSTASNSAGQGGESQVNTKGGSSSATNLTYATGGRVSQGGYATSASDGGAEVGGTSSGNSARGTGGNRDGSGGMANGGSSALSSGGTGYLAQGGTRSTRVGTGGGISSTGGAIGSGGTNAGGTQISCSITIKTKSLSTVIPTVGIVEWSTELSGLTEANVEFGLDTKYGMSAPVDLKEANYRTLILGMKAGGKVYHFRVVAKSGDKTCTGQDNTLPATGDPPTSLPQLTFSPTKADGLDGGFLVFETLKQTFGAGVPDSPAYIIDGDGDFVWWYTKTGIIDVGRTRQSYDGKYMWIAAVNVLSGKSRVIRVKMDGSEEKDFTSEFADLNHDFAVRSDETIAFIAYGSNNCDDIKERSPDGTVTTIINSGTAVGASACHCNAINYDRNDDTIVFSDLDSSSIVKVTRDTKKVVWLMSSQNAANATITGINWKNQHNFHIVDKSHLLFFNNNTGPNSTAIEAELTLNGGKGTAKQIWSYPSTVTVQILGDVQRLGNDNTLITYSTAGEIREVNSAGTVLQTIKSVGSGNLFGFAEKRKSLYGPPPR
jgi:hypothetical protein